MGNSGKPADMMQEITSASGLDFQETFQSHFSQALMRHAHEQHGQIKQRLQKKLEQLTHPARIDWILAPENTVDSTKNAPPGEQTSGTLADLLEYIASQSTTDHLVSTNGQALLPYPEMASLEYFRKISSQLRLHSQVRLTMLPAPADAGPLNSTTLVHRSLALMREVAPGYLLQFLSYIDTLAWMEQLSDLVTMPHPQQQPKRSSKRSHSKPKNS